MTKHTLACLGVVLWIGLTGCEQLQQEIRIPKSTLQENIDQKFPYDRNAIVARLTLSDPEIFFENNRVGLTIRFKGNYLEKSVDGSATFDGDLDYDASDHAFYLKAFKVIGVEVDNTSLDDADRVVSVIESILNNYLDDYPVYRLSSDSANELLARLFLKDVQVEGDDLVVTLGL